jgi:hypothetical protein
MSDVTAITLFAGAGGWDLGFAAMLVQRGLASLGYRGSAEANRIQLFPDSGKEEESRVSS